MPAPGTVPWQSGSPPPAPNRSVTDVDAEKDLQAIVDGASDAARARLQGMPPGAAEAEVRRIVGIAIQVYRDAVAKGEPPGVAQQKALGEADYQALLTAERNGLQPPSPASPDTGVQSKDVTDALNTFRQAVDPNNGKPYRQIVDAPSTKIEERDVTASTAAAPQLGDATMQAKTTVEATDYDTRAGDEARQLQLQNLRDLQATARGEGAGQDAAAARMRLALLRNQQQASGNIQGARGAERRGLRRAELQQRGERQLAADIAGQAQSATERQAAQAAVGQQTSDIRKTDVDVETTRAGFEEKRKTLQAQLDSARRANNQAAINDFTKKLADLDADIAKFNASQTQNADTGNANRSVDVQDKNVDNTRDDNDQRIRAQKAIEDAAKGLLDENQRQEELTLAKRRLALAEEEFKFARDEAARKAAQEKVQFWAGMVERLLGKAAGIATAKPAAAQGGLVTEPTLVAEGKHDELVIPVTGLTAALRKALAVEAKPFAQPVPIQALMKVLKKQGVEDRKAPPKGIAVLLAASNQKARKAAGAR